MNLFTLAHAGHGHTEGTSLLHYLIEPAHMPYAVGLGVVVIAIAVVGLRKAVRCAMARRH